MKRHLTVIFVCLAGVLAYGQHPWRLSAVNPLEGPYSSETVANGVLGLRSARMPLVNDAVILAGTYDVHPTNRIDTYFDNIRFMDLDMTVDGKQVTAADLSDYTQTLDMRHACLTSQFTVMGRARVEMRQYALQQLPYSALTDIVIHPLRDAVVTVANRPYVPENLSDARYSYNRMVKKRGTVYLLTTEARGRKEGLRMAAATSFVFDGNAGAKAPEVSYDSTAHSAVVRLPLKKGADCRFALAGSLMSSQQSPNPRNEADRLTILATLSGSRTLIDGHNAAWDRLWQGDIVIEGDAQAQRDVHAMLYHLYSNVRAGSAQSIPPMGVTGTGYYGHVFWDAEIWMMPALLLLHPEMARSMIDYRIDRLDQARKNAFSRGYRGAMYPWESAAAGMEDTPTWALTGVFEHHITGCVALAAWQYYCVTDDIDWLRERAYPMIADTADFWVSRTVTDADGSRHIRGVCCADEYASSVAFLHFH